MCFLYHVRQRLREIKLPIRRFIPLLIANAVVVLAIAISFIKFPSHPRIAAAIMLLLFVMNFWFIRRMQKNYVAEIASGTASPPSAGKKRAAIWFLGIYGAASYVSGVFNLPALFSMREFGPWLGWSVKIAIGTLCIWLALRIRSSLKLPDIISDQQR